MFRLYIYFQPNILNPETLEIAILFVLFWTNNDFRIFLAGRYVSFQADEECSLKKKKKE